MKSSSKADFKKPLRSITILAGLMQIIRPILLKLHLFGKQISLNLAIFGKSKGNFREKNCVSVETIIHNHRY